MHDIMTVCCSPKVWWKILLSTLAELLCGSSAGTCYKAQLSPVGTGKTRAVSLSLWLEETAFFHFNFFHQLLHPYIKCLHISISIRCHVIFLLWSALEAGIRDTCCTNPLVSFRCRFWRQVILSCMASLSCIQSPALGSLSNWSCVNLMCGGVKTKKICLQGKYYMVRCHT